MKLRLEIRWTDELEVLLEVGNDRHKMPTASQLSQHSLNSLYC
jgi:hypothetical protein